MSRSSAHFLIGLFVFLKLTCMSCLYILEINPLSVALFATIFFHSEGYLFVLFMVFFAVLKILQARLQQYMKCELPHVQAHFRKGRGTRDPIANIRWIIEKQESSRKASISVLLTMPKPLTVWITTNCGKFFKRWEYQTT